jgi:26S proteasome regulatory subunit N13
MDLTPSPLPDSPDQQEILFEFRAGKMTKTGTRVTPDPRKGLVRLLKGEDTLTHFQWWDRGLNSMEDIIFPQEATFKKVEQSSGRVYLLSFKHDDRKFFFWMQETREENDADICNIVMHHLNRPLEDEEDEPEDSSQAISETSEGAVPDKLEAPSDLNEGATASSDDIPHGSSSGVVQLADLQRILTGLGQTPGDIGMARDRGMFQGTAERHFNKTCLFLAFAAIGSMEECSYHICLHYFLSALQQDGNLHI